MAFKDIIDLVSKNPKAAFVIISAIAVVIGYLVLTQYVGPNLVNSS